MATPFEIVTTRHIKAPPSVVYAIMQDFNRWREWSPWAEQDPDMTYTVTEPGTGVGTVYAWEGPKTGEGTMTIAELEENHRVSVALAFTKPFQAQNTVVWTVVEASDGGSDVTWTMLGERGLLMRFLSFVMRMDATLKTTFARGLELLDEVATR